MLLVNRDEYFDYWLVGNHLSQMGMTQDCGVTRNFAVTQVYEWHPYTRMGCVLDWDTPHTQILQHRVKNTSPLV
jgi:hypothetical protein